VRLRRPARRPRRFSIDARQSGLGCVGARPCDDCRREERHLSSSERAALLVGGGGASRSSGPTGQSAVAGGSRQPGTRLRPRNAPDEQPPQTRQRLATVPGRPAGEAPNRSSLRATGRVAKGLRRELTPRAAGVCATVSSRSSRGRGGSGSVVLLSRRFPAVPDALQQPTLALGVFLGGVVGVDLAGFSIYDLVRPVCLSNAVGQAMSLSGRR